jgi:nitrite reductase/ring-hydroxylating ferredoxin subunit
MLVKVALEKDIVPGKMLKVEAGGKQVVLARYQDGIYAFQRRCGHMSAPLELGVLKGKMVICPLHYALFDITTGKKISDPVHRARDTTKLPEEERAYAERLAKLMTEVTTCDLEVYPVKVEGEDVLIDI